MKILCYDPKKEKTVLCGNTEGDTFIRIVEPKHFMNIVQGYGIQEIAFQEVLEKGIKNICLKVSTTKDNWEADIKTWLEHSKVMDFGHGKQRFLSLKYMSNKKEKK